MFFNDWKKVSALEKIKVTAKKINHQDSKITKPMSENQLNNNVIKKINIPVFKSSKQEFKTISIDKEAKQMIK